MCMVGYLFSNNSSYWFRKKYYLCTVEASYH
nr:MAG TPA: hypothetical protein [Caudoviricetes sp.]